MADQPFPQSHPLPPARQRGAGGNGAAAAAARAHSPLNAYDRVTLGLLVDLMLPTATHEDAYQGEGTRAEIRMTLDVDIAEWLVWSGNAGTLLRADGATRVANIDVGNSLTLGTGAMARFNEPHDLWAVGEVAALFSFGAVRGVDIEEVPLELRGGVKWFVTDHLLVQGGAGFGIVEGFGTPDYRLYAGVHFNQRPEEGCYTRQWPDDDEDLICETDEEFELECDVCRPRLDGDFPEPHEIREFAERDDAAHYWRVGYYPGESTDDRVDADSDGWPDACDICHPDHACGDADTADGTDTDSDGIPDGCDECPDGTDLLDTDGDCIVDCLDSCPEDAEMWNGVEDEDGCPEFVECPYAAACPELDVFPFVDQTYGGVPFFFDYDVYREFTADPVNGYDRERNEDLLDQIALILTDPCLRYAISVEGHTDSDGNAEYNEWLGTMRARRVYHGLTSPPSAEESDEWTGVSWRDRGVDSGMVTYATFGESQTLNADNQEDDYAPGNRENRRVILRIVGCEEVGERLPEPFPVECSEPTHGRRCGS